MPGDAGCPSRGDCLSQASFSNAEEIKEKYNDAVSVVLPADHFIADEDVRYYFSAADALVLPYRTATQSGVTQIAYNFSLPMVVTRVGGLAEIVPDGVVGLCCEPTEEAIEEAMRQLYEDDTLQRMKANFAQERKRFSWDAMCDKLLEVLSMANRSDD